MEDNQIKFPASLQVTEQPVDLSGLSEKQKSFYLKLLHDIAEVYHSRNKPRLILGIAGPTGAGKSVIAVLLKELSKQAQLPFAVEAITIDAYHYPNQYLLSHYWNGEPLKKIKGRFDTYNPAALARDLRHFAAGDTVSFPAYSRQLHDPVKDALLVNAQHVLLIVEGLWVLYGESGWEEVRSLLDYSIFIDADPVRVKGPVLKRHMRGGRTAEDAERHYEQVDAKNAELVLATKPNASRVIPSYYSV